jgi:hypothetical protein
VTESSFALSNCAPPKPVAGDDRGTVSTSVGLPTSPIVTPVAARPPGLMGGGKKNDVIGDRSVVDWSARTPERVSGHRP